MILVCTDFQKFQLVTIFDLQTHIAQLFINLRIENRATIFRRKHKVVKQYRNVMALMNIFAHANILRRKRRGIEP